jgi:hypothetical protein
MPAPAVKPFELSEDDLTDRTMELDMRWMQYEDAEPPKKKSGTDPVYDDPTVVLDLSATQVHDLLTKK